MGLSEDHRAAAAITPAMKNTAQYCSATTVGVQVAKDVDGFGLARAEESHGSLDGRLRQMYQLAEKARLESIANNDKLRAICAGMLEITRMIPVHLQQIEQDQSTCGSETGCTSLRVLAQVHKASESLEAFVLNTSSSSEDWWVDIEQSLERTISVVKDDEPSAARKHNQKVNRGKQDGPQDKRHTEPIPVRKATFDVKDVFCYMGNKWQTI